MSEKTEQPTAKRLREALRNGQIPRSRLAGAGLATLGGVFGALVGAPEGIASLRGLTVRVFGLEMLSPHQGLTEAALVLARLCGPALLGAFVGAAIGTVATS